MKPKTPKMTDHRRDLMLMIAEGRIDHPVLPVLHHFDQYTRCDEILTWIIRNNISGDEVVGMIKTRFNKSPMDFVKWVLKKINHDTQFRPIIVGRDIN